MKVYIVTAENQFECTAIFSVHDSEYKAKAFCEKKYGMKIENWIEGSTANVLFYDDDDFNVEHIIDESYSLYYNHFIFSNFTIHIRDLNT